MTPVRVLQVLTCDGLGGTEMMVATLVERLDRSVVEPAVVTLEPPGPIAERLGSSACTVRSLGGSGLGMAFLRLARILRRERFEVVNAYGFKSTAIVRCLVRALSPGTQFVSGVRGLHVAELEEIDGAKSRLLLLLERLSSGLVDAYDANSLGAIELLARQGIDRTRLHYIPNGIDVRRWPAASANGATNQTPTIVCVARFVPRKRHIDLIEAAAHLVRVGVSFRLIMVGTGPMLDRSREQCCRLGLGEPMVRFAGLATPEEVSGFLARAHVFCLPSLWEGMAGGVMEAMSSGLPVVGTEVNGISDLVRHGYTGLLVPPRRPDRLADALATLLRDRPRMEAMGRAGRARIVEQFEVDRMVRAKQELFTSVAASA